MKRWPLSKAYFWQEAPFFRLLPPVVAGIVCYDRLGLQLPAAALPPALLLMTSLLLPLAIRRRKLRGVPVLMFVATQAWLFLFSLWSCSLGDIRRNRSWLGNARDSLSACLVRVSEPPAEKGRVLKLRVRLLQGLKDSSACRPLTGEAFLMAYKGGALPAVAEGDTLLLPAHWQLIANAGNPFEFDYQTFCRRRNICHQQLIRPAELIVYARASPQDFSWIDRFHLFCDRQLQRYLTDSATRGLLQAMLLGDETHFDPALRQAYSETGVVHIVSISGSHVAVLFLVVTSLLFWLRGRVGRGIKYAVGLLLVWGYVVMAGAPPSAVRSAMMFSLLAFGINLSREAQPLNTLLAAAFILLCGEPMWLFAIGFQLSFGAVLSLLLFYRPLYRMWPQPSRIGRWAWGAAAASIAAEVLTAPLVVYYFHNFPLFFLPANLLAVGLVGVGVLVGGMLVIACSFLPPAAAGVAFLVTGATRLFNAVIGLLQGWNPLSFRYLQLSAAELCLVYLLIAGFALSLLQRVKWELFAGLGGACALLLLLCLDRAAALQEQRLVVYNISRHNWIEQLQGGRYRVLYQDTLAEDHYIVRQARTAWHCWRCSPQPAPGSCFTVAGQTVLLLEEEPGGGSFPVDILIVQRPLKGLSPSVLQAVFRPGLLVAGSGQPRWLVQQWKDSCRRLGLHFHATGVDGAFVLEEGRQPLLLSSRRN